MSDTTRTALVERLRKASIVVYLAAEESVAADLSDMLKQAADALTAAPEREAVCVLEEVLHDAIDIAASPRENRVQGIVWIIERHLAALRVESPQEDTP